MILVKIWTRTNEPFCHDLEDAEFVTAIERLKKRQAVEAEMEIRMRNGSYMRPRRRQHLLI
jgi:hypothetical protein